MFQCLGSVGFSNTFSNIRVLESSIEPTSETKYGTNSDKLFFPRLTEACLVFYNIGCEAIYLQSHFISCLFAVFIRIIFILLPISEYVNLCIYIRTSCVYTESCSPRSTVVADFLPNFLHIHFNKH